MNLNVFRLLIQKSPLEKLCLHYEKIQQSVVVIEKFLKCYIEAEGVRKAECKAQQDRLNELESEADSIIRDIRNELPKGIFLAVNKSLVLNYTNAQDNILDSAQEALNWLSMRPMSIPAEFRKDFERLANHVKTIVSLLGPALEHTISLVHLESLDREEAKEQYKTIRGKKDQAFKLKQVLCEKIFCSGLESRDLLQLVHFTESMFAMCHNCGKCAEIMRSMIVR